MLMKDLAHLRKKHIQDKWDALHGFNRSQKRRSGHGRCVELIQVPVDLVQLLVIFQVYVHHPSSIGTQKGAKPSGLLLPMDHSL